MFGLLADPSSRRHHLRLILASERSYERAAELANWSRTLAARRPCAVAESEAPADPRVIALRLWLRGGFKRSGNQKAQREAQALSRVHPEVVEPTRVDAALTYRLGPNHHLVGISALEERAASFGGRPEYEATLAAFLAQRGWYDEAWEHYGSALSNDGIPSPAHRASAYRCAASGVPR